MSKVYRPSERSWTEGADLQAINAAACKSIGRIRTDEKMEDWAQNLFQNNDSSHCPEKRSASINLWNENGPMTYKKVCYDGSSSTTRENCTGNAQSTVSARLPLGPSTIKTSIAHNMVSATEEALCLSNARTTSISSTTLIRNETAILTQDIKSPFLLQEHDLCWFAQPVSEGRQPCLFWTSCKRQIPKERRLHSLASFLAGCGWIASDTSGRAAQVRRGVIVVDDCDEACKASILDTLDHLWTSSTSPDGRTAIWVFGCRSSNTPLQIYQSFS